MMSHFSQTIRTKHWFLGFVFLHVFLWTLAPAWVRHTLPMDAMEGTTWGHQLEWGYDKNPFLNAWLTQIAILLGGKSSWVIYLFSQVSVAICFGSVWSLGQKFLPPIYALIAVLLLESMQYFNLHAIDFNDNTLEVGLWAATIWFYYQALTEKKLKDWLLTGLFAGLGMMAKYYTAVLLVPMGVFFFIIKKKRKKK
jgi:4-amino-4-deoxy-L-arabinose transferase-like glycosyltransferase